MGKIYADFVTSILFGNSLDFINQNKDFINVPKKEIVDIEYEEVTNKQLVEGTQTKHSKDVDRFYPQDL